jgi:hypothetical protein
VTVQKLGEHGKVRAGGRYANQRALAPGEAQRL